MSNFVHQELQTANPEAATKFYASLFGWTHQAVPMSDGVYHMLSGPDGAGIGGISPAMPNVSTGWIGYIAVASVDETTAKVTANGGRVLLPKQEVPGMGWFAWYADPQGDRFAVWESSTPPPAPPAAKPAKKKAAKKKAAKKKAAKKKPAAKKAAKKPAKKAAKKKPAKKAAKKKPAKKAAKKKPAKKAAKKKPAKKAAKKKAAKKKRAGKK